MTINPLELHSLALGQYGDVYSWGRGREGQLGTREIFPISSIPLHIKSLRSVFLHFEMLTSVKLAVTILLSTIVLTLTRHEKIVDIACGNFHNIAVAESGR